jgi:hypothetical protein
MHAQAMGLHFQMDYRKYDLSESKRPSFELVGRTGKILELGSA